MAGRHVLSVGDSGNQEDEEVNRIIDTAPVWSEEEDTIIATMVNLPVKTTLARLEEAGYHRTSGAVRNRRSFLRHRGAPSDVVQRLNNTVRQRAAIQEQMNNIAQRRAEDESRLTTLREEAHRLNALIAELTNQLIQEEG